MCYIVSSLEVRTYSEAKTDKETNAVITPLVGNIGPAEEDVERPAKCEGGEESCGGIRFNRGIIRWWRQRSPLR